MGKFFKTYKPFTRAGILEAMTYRVNFFFYILGDVLKCFIMFFLWKAVFTSSSQEAFMGFTMPDMVLYIFVTFLTGFLTYSDGAYAIGEEIRDGSIAMRMIKPVSFDMAFLFQELGRKLIEITFLFIPIMVGVELFRFFETGEVQFNGAAFGLYVVSAVLAYLVNFYFHVCYGFSAFVLKNLWGANILKTSIVDFLSGATIPLAFMPAALQGVLQLLPFASLSYTPVMIYMGMYDSGQILFYLGLQVLWLAAFWALSKVIWKAAIKRLCVQGG